MATEASSMESPQKNRSFTSSAFLGASLSSCLRASSSASRSGASPSWGAMVTSKSTRFMAPPRFEDSLRRAPLDKNPSHCLRRRSKEMPATVPVLGLLNIHQPEISLVNQRRRLESMIFPFAGHFRCRQLTQIFIHQRQQLLGSRWITLLDLGEDLCDIGHGDQDTPAKWVSPSAVLASEGSCVRWQDTGKHLSPSVR